MEVEYFADAKAEILRNDTLGKKFALLQIQARTESPSTKQAGKFCSRLPQ